MKCCEPDLSYQYPKIKPQKTDFSVIFSPYISAKYHHCDCHAMGISIRNDSQALPLAMTEPMLHHAIGKHRYSALANIMLRAL